MIRAMFGWLFGGRENKTVEAEFGGTEIYAYLYEVEKGGANHELSTYARMHEDNLTGSDARVNVTINADSDDYEEISDGTPERCELLLAALIDRELNLINAQHKHGSNDAGLLP